MHETELPAVTVWLLDCVITAGHGVAVGVALPPAVAVGVAVGGATVGVAVAVAVTAGVAVAVAVGVAVGVGVGATRSSAPMSGWASRVWPSISVKTPTAKPALMAGLPAWICKSAGAGTVTNNGSAAIEFASWPVAVCQLARVGWALPPMKPTFCAK